MTQLKRQVIFFGWFILVSVHVTRSQSSVNYNASNLGINTVTTAVPFMLITPDSRGGGMGDVGAATSPDVYAMHWNPAKFAFAEKQMGVGISYTPWLRQLVPDINLAYLSGYGKLTKTSAIAGSLRYFSLGSIQFTDINGNSIGNYKPNEFAIDLGFSQQLSKKFSGGMAARFIYSNLTSGVPLANGTTTKAGTSIAVDVAGLYRDKDIKLGDKKGEFSVGLNISNIGQKISYTDNPSPQSKDFIPINLRLGTALKINVDEYNTFTIAGDLTKLLVPTPPRYKRDSNGNPIPDNNGGYVIEAGKDPHRSVTAGMFGSFNDAPGGAKEELKEINPAIGLEYWYAERFAVRTGMFYEDKTKGNRRFLTFGLGVRLSVFGLDLAYLVPLSQRNPLQNTLRVSLTFDFDAFKKQNAENPTE